MAWILHVGSGTLQISLHHLAERGLVHSTPQGWVVTDFKESQAAPNSTERSRASRRKRTFGTQGEDESSDKETDGAAQGAADSAVKMQPIRPYPVVGPVPAPDPDPDWPMRAAKSRHRHKTRPKPVEKPVDKTVEKGRKISDSTPSTSSTSSLTKHLKTSLNLKLPLLVLDQETEPEKFPPSQAKNLKNKRGAPGSAHVDAAQQVPPGRIEQDAQQNRITPEAMQAPVDKTVDNYPGDTYPVDKTVEKGRKISDPNDIPP